MERSTFRALLAFVAVAATGAWLLGVSCGCSDAPPPLPLPLPQQQQQQQQQQSDTRGSAPVKEIFRASHANTKPLCKSMPHFTRRGKVAGLFGWDPADCVLEPSLAFEPCVRKKHLVFLGDSLSREVFSQVAKMLKAKPGVVSLPASRPELEGCKPIKSDKSRECAIVSNSSYDAGAGGSIRFLWTPVVTPEQNLILSSPLAKETLQRADYVLFSTGMWEMGLKGVPLADFIPWAITKIEMLKARIGPQAVLVVFPHHWIHLDSKMPGVHLREGCNSGGKLALYRAALIEAAVCSGVEVFDSSSITRHMTHALKQDGVHYAAKVELQLMVNSMCRTDPPFPWPTPHHINCTLPGGIKRYTDEFARKNLTVGCLTRGPHDPDVV
ncbi:hypothetical protein DIPPA_06134 [Diplonema papillatum]|nr:hypothetical protein DIPPA_06134 [Diplonema papillatum]